MMLHGQVALVTDAGRGSGAAIASGLAEHGAAVIVTDIDLSTVQQSAANIAARGGRAVAVHLDVTKNVASIAAFRAVKGSIGYSSSKAAVKMLTETLAGQLACDGVRVNAIAPGFIDTRVRCANLCTLRLSHAQ